MSYPLSFKNILPFFNKIIMSEGVALSNVDLANIYENIINGDKNALSKLQQINNKSYVPRFIDSYYEKKHKNNI